MAVRYVGEGEYAVQVSTKTLIGELRLELFLGDERVSAGIGVNVVCPAFMAQNGDGSCGCKHAEGGADAAAGGGGI